jgi:hypothetical protein
LTGGILRWYLIFFKLQQKITKRLEKKGRKIATTVRERVAGWAKD